MSHNPDDDPGGQGDLQPDRLEENDTRQTGELLTPNFYGNLTITPGDRDWILFDVCVKLAKVINEIYCNVTGTRNIHVGVIDIVPCYI